MRVAPFISGIATGAIAGAVVSVMAAGAMMNPTVRKNAQATTKKVGHTVQKAADSVSHMIG